MPDVAARHGIPIPSEFEEPYFATARSRDLAVDAATHANSENSQLQFLSSGNVGWDADAVSPTKGLVFWQDKFAACCDELILCTNDGTAGIKGLITDGIKVALDRHADRPHRHDEEHARHGLRHQTHLPPHLDEIQAAFHWSLLRLSVTELMSLECRCPIAA